MSQEAAGNGGGPNFRSDHLGLSTLRYPLPPKKCYVPKVVEEEGRRQKPLGELPFYEDVIGNEYALNSSV